MPDERYFSMPSAEVGGDVRRNRALNCWPWVRSLTHSPEAVIHSPAEMVASGSRPRANGLTTAPMARGRDPLAGGNGCGIANHGHDVTMPARLGAQNAKTVLGVEVGH